MKRELMQQLLDSNEIWDVVIIGGGATGLGTAIDAASRGYKTLLIEQSDFAKGTSSKSTKLIHGGLRYLKQGNISLVREALRERELLFNNAPHLIHPLAFVIPCYHEWEKAYYYIGLKIYDLLAGKLHHEGSRSLSTQRTASELPTVKTEGLCGGLCYYDGQFDDARLAITLAQTLANVNGTVINYVAATELLKANGRVCGVVAQDMETKKQYQFRARAVVNATGAFCDAIRKIDDPEVPPLISPSRGVHIVLPRSFLPGHSALMIPRTEDGRVLFVLPWYNRVLVGTTDTPVSETPLDPKPSADEIAFLLEQASKYLTKKPVQGDILSTFAGLRPLVKPRSNKKTAAISRDHTILVSKSGLITVAGGKWTTYRKMGEDVVNQVIQVGQLPKRPCISKSVQLHGWTAFVDRWDVTSCYGSDAAELEKLIKANRELGQRIHPNLPYLDVEVVWAVRSEMARTLEDVLARRTRSILLDARASIEAAPRVARIMAKELQKDENWIIQQVNAFMEFAKAYLPT